MPTDRPSGERPRDIGLDARIRDLVRVRSSKERRVEARGKTFELAAYIAELLDYYGVPTTELVQSDRPNGHVPPGETVARVWVFASGEANDPSDSDDYRSGLGLQPDGRLGEYTFEGAHDKTLPRLVEEVDRYEPLTPDPANDVLRWGETIQSGAFDDVPDFGPIEMSGPAEAEHPVHIEVALQRAMARFALEHIPDLVQ